jgi:hypothetical protein
VVSRLPINYNVLRELGENQQKERSHRRSRCGGNGKGSFPGIGLSTIPDKEQDLKHIGILTTVLSIAVSSRHRRRICGQRGWKYVTSRVCLCICVCLGLSTKALSVYIAPSMP